MQVIETTVYLFNELSDAAKEKARAWWRKGSEDDNEWHKCVTGEWENQFLPAMGWRGARIGFRGFWSQGDGAHFAGEWHSCNVKPDFLKSEGVNDDDLLGFLVAYDELAKRYPNAFCKVVHRGHYQHENCTDFSVRLADENDDEICDGHADDFEKEITELSREVMRHIYRCLEKTWDWCDADEQVDENIIANEYTFTASGHRFG